MFLTHIGRGRASTYDFATVPSPNTCPQSHFIAHGGLISLQAGHSFAVSVTLGPPFHPAQVARLRLVNISPSTRRSPREWPSAPKSKVGGEAGAGSYLVDTLVTEGNEKPAPLGSTRPFHQLVLNSHVGVICGQLFGTYTRGDPVNASLHNVINGRMGFKDYLFAGVDSLNATIDQALSEDKREMSKEKD